VVSDRLHLISFIYLDSFLTQDGYLGYLPSNADLLKVWIDEGIIVLFFLLSFLAKKNRFYIR
jgi:hypothetical protein